ncbi:hypothetical protein Cfor_01134 [Coptotermes formosanus]|uniref:Phosphate transporter n=1 Tax=Coptotermes formosanus TaxID=36987 RepID=A0A6L2PZT0_COPFO|nr:hypothetical protein Cfor_01134 [Coptotermes formosanus]
MIEPYSPDVVWIVVVGYIVAFVLAFGLGANDVANSFGTSVGSKVLSVKQACCIATVVEIAGAILIGYKVSDTMRKGILRVDVYEAAEVEFMLGMFAALIGGAVWLLIATFLKLPVSATHSIVGATIGFSLVCRGDEGLNWEAFGLIVGSWFLSPLLSGLISVALYTLIRYLILIASDPISRGLLCLPVFYGVTIFINVFTVVHDGSSLLYFDRIPLWGAFVASIGLGLVAMLVVHFIGVPIMRKKIEGKIDAFSHVSASLTQTAVKVSLLHSWTILYAVPMGPSVQQIGSSIVTRLLSGMSSSTRAAFTAVLEENRDVKNKKPVESVEARRIYVLFSFLQTMTATFASFVHGGNDVSNAIGPVIAIWLTYTEGNVKQKAETPIYLLLYGGVGISVGLWVWGRRVMKTIGEDLTTITSSTGFTIELGAAFTVLLATKLGLPVSTTHCLVGSVVFVGWASSSKEGVDWKLFRQVLHFFSYHCFNSSAKNIALAWVVTVPASGLLSAAAVAILREIVL